MTRTLQVYGFLVMGNQYSRNVGVRIIHKLNMRTPLIQAKVDVG